MSDDRFFIDNELHLSCADAIELVTDFLDNALGDADLREFTAHLESCEGCRVYLDQIERTVRIASQTRAHDVPVTPANFDQLLAEIERRRDDDPGGDAL